MTLKIECRIYDGCLLEQKEAWFESAYLSLDILGLILVVIGLHADLQLLDERLLGVLVYSTQRKQWLDIFVVVYN